MLPELPGSAQHLVTLMGGIRFYRKDDGPNINILERGREKVYVITHNDPGRKDVLRRGVKQESRLDDLGHALIGEKALAVPAIEKPFNTLSKVHLAFLTPALGFASVFINNLA